MSGYKERDAAHDTNESRRRVSAAWHQARDDANARGNPPADRPTDQNRVNAQAKMRELIERGRARAKSERTRQRGER